MDEYIPLVDTRHVFRISKFVILTFFRIQLIALAFCYLHISLTGQKIFVKFRCCLHSSSKICKYGTRVQRSECEKLHFEWLIFFINMLYNSN